MSLNIPNDRDYPGIEVAYNLLPGGSDININPAGGYTIIYPGGATRDLVEFVHSVPGLGTKIVQATVTAWNKKND